MKFASKAGRARQSLLKQASRVCQSKLFFYLSGKFFGLPNKIKSTFFDIDKLCV
jgi:hypothetical protein